MPCDTINLKDFCDPRESKRALFKPFILDGAVIATDGKILVRVFDTSIPHELVGPSDDSKNKIRGWLAAIPKAGIPGWFAPPDFEPIPAIKCDICNGYGAGFVCDTCGGDGHMFPSVAECPTCNGDDSWRPSPDGTTDCGECYGMGKHIQRRRIELPGGVWVDISLLTPLVREFQNVRLYPRKPKQMIWVRFDGGDGLLMPVTKRYQVWEPWDMKPYEPLDGRVNG